MLENLSLKLWMTKNSILLKIKLFMQYTDPEIFHNIIKFIHCGANFEWFCTVKKKKSTFWICTCGKLLCTCGILPYEIHSVKLHCEITLWNTLINSGTYFGRHEKYFRAILHHQTHTTGTRKCPLQEICQHQPLPFRIPVVLSVVGEMTSVQQTGEKLFLTSTVMVVIPFSLKPPRLWYLNCKLLTLWHQEAKALSPILLLQWAQRSQPRFMSLLDTSGWHRLKFQMHVKFQAMNIDGDLNY